MPKNNPTLCYWIPMSHICEVKRCEGEEESLSFLSSYSEPDHSPSISDIHEMITLSSNPDVLPISLTDTLVTTFLTLQLTVFTLHSQYCVSWSMQRSKKSGKNLKQINNIKEFSQIWQKQRSVAYITFSKLKTTLN